MVNFMKGRYLIFFTMILLIVIGLSPIFPFINKVGGQQAPNGPMVDEVDFFAEKDYAKVVKMLKSGDMDIYFSDISDADIFNTQIKNAPNLKYKFAYGLYFELTFNPVGPKFKNGMFNPFFDRKIREALNYVIDREYIANEIMKGLGKPKYTLFSPAFPEYARIADTVKQVESQYKYNFEKGRNIIFEELSGLGATYENGKWYYDGKQIEIKFIIRTEDSRKDIGDYVASVLENLGFKVDRMYKTSREASPLWLFGNPADGDWSLYTGGWINTIIPRDQSSDFAFFYTPMGLPLPLWQAYKPDPIFYNISATLAYGKWKSWDERQKLMRKALEYSVKDSVRVWLIDQIAPFAMRKDVDAAVDLASAFSNRIWGLTIRKGEGYGGVIKAGSREVLVDPWNPVAGSDWTYDRMMMDVISDVAYQHNPYTGLLMPNNFVSAEVDVASSSPVIKSSDWLTLKFVNKIEVPSDAFFGYNPIMDSIINPPKNTTATVKVTINYGDVLGKDVYHDGTTMTLADFYTPYLITFARATSGSPLYDKSYLPDFQEWNDTFKGFKIVSEKPFVVEYYYDYLALEAEDIIYYVIDWPTFPWQVYAIGVIAESDQKAAFSAGKADELGVEWMNYIGGPSLQILKSALDKAVSTRYLPFKNILSRYVSEKEMVDRYHALENWYKEHGHFFVANGPYYLDRADFTGHQAVLKAFRQYPNKADKWAWLSEPPIPEVSIKVPQYVVPGLKESFKIDLSYKGSPYPVERINFVKYLITDASGNVLISGDAKSTAGKFAVDLNSTQTGGFKPGSYKITIIAVSKDVGMPAIAEETFGVIPQISYFETLVSSLQNQLNSKINTLDSSINELRQTVNNLSGVKSSVESLSSTVNISIILSILAIVISIIAVFLSKKR